MSRAIVELGRLTEKRKYELKKRAERLNETRRKITEATVELHLSVGPAATQISEIARRAGVQRVTVYNHFPDELSLLTACSAHWRGLHPAPSPAGWDQIADPSKRLRVALHDLYGWFRETEPMTANVLRDAQAMDALAAILDRGLGTYLVAVQKILVDAAVAGSGKVAPARRERVEAAARVAADFHCWRALSPLGDDAAAGLAAGLVELAASTAARAPERSPKRRRA